MEQRKIDEQAFHNQREKDRLSLSTEAYLKKYSNKKMYAITATSSHYLDQWFKRHVNGKTCLDYCCGLGGLSLKMKKCGGVVYGIDISNESINTATNLLKREGYDQGSFFKVMDAEKMTFKENMFDCVLCSGVLHHLRLDEVYPELNRVIKPTGRIICVEALGVNPLIQWYRNRTPHLRTSWEKDHILSLNDVRLAKKYFKHIKIKYFHLATILAIPFRKTKIFRPLLKILESIDAVLLKIPGVRLLAWQMIFELSDPIK